MLLWKPNTSRQCGNATHEWLSFPCLPRFQTGLQNLNANCLILPKKPKLSMAYKTSCHCTHYFRLRGSICPTVGYHLNVRVHVGGEELVISQWSAVATCGRGSLWQLRAGPGSNTDLDAYPPWQFLIHPTNKIFKLVYEHLTLAQQPNMQVNELASKHQKSSIQIVNVIGACHIQKHIKTISWAFIINHNLSC